MVPEALGGPGRRAARLDPHERGTARKAKGLEAAIADHSWTFIRSLEGTDPRVLDIKVAGPGALLVAKLHKLAERQSTPSRQDDKDALDVYRLMRSIPSRQLGVDF